MKYLLFILSFLFCEKVFCQEKYFQQSLRYSISAELDDTKNVISGTETISYTNNSDSTLSFIWFHLWPNAYSNERTALFQQMKNDRQRPKKGVKAGLGAIDSLAFKINNTDAKTSPHPNPAYTDIVQLQLNEPLRPGVMIVISTSFKTTLPPYFSRSGYADGEIMACQWYPKPAVFDKNGWHEFPYLDMGEFYSEFADYDVTLTLPSQYIVGATGTLTTPTEIFAYKTVGGQNTVNRRGKPALYTAADLTAKKTLNWRAANVPDFAWFADKDFVIQYDTIMLSGGKNIDAFTYSHNKKSGLWRNSIDYVKDATHAYSRWVGEYAWPVVQAAEGPKNNYSGGMEYPMITLITSPNARREDLDAVIAHEVGHNWFMGMLGSNERAHGWMDEGLNTYYQFRYEAEKYRSNSTFGDALPQALRNTDAATFLQRIYDILGQSLNFKQEMDVPANEKTIADDYSNAVYLKTAVWLYMLESAVTEDKLTQAMQRYFSQWKFKHPQPEDMQASFEEVLGPLQEFFDLTKKKGKLD